MKAHIALFSISALCRVLGVSSSGYYACLTRAESSRSKANKNLLSRLTECFEASRKTYGVRRLTAALKQQDMAVNHKRVARIKRENNIYPTACVKRPRTTQSNPTHPVVSNHLGREFDQTEAHHVWVGDITYLACEQGWLYLAIWLDLFSRKVVGWSLSYSLHTRLILDAFDSATIRHGTAPDWVHADRGCQYTSTAFRKTCEQQDVLLSMSRKGNCWDNAVAESFFATLKRECIGDLVFTDLTEAKAVLFDYIEVFYNRQRLHSTLDYLSPAQYELQRLVA